MSVRSLAQVRALTTGLREAVKELRYPSSVYLHRTLRSDTETEFVGERRKSKVKRGQVVVNGGTCYRDHSIIPTSQSLLKLGFQFPFSRS